MQTIEERVSSLEGRMDEQSHTLSAIRADIAELGRRMDQRFTAVDQRFAVIDQRFVGIDHRFVSIDQRFVSLEQRFDQRLVNIEQKMSTQFYWLLGVQMTTWISLTALLAGTLFRR